MSTNPALRVRRSLTELQDEYEKGEKKPLEDLMRAWKGIKALPPEDPNSFFKLGGYHGEPFRGAGWGSSAYWGGYCNHGNVLFPVWHRVYVLKLEDALRSIPGCEDVTLPFWDECSAECLEHGIPWALTNEKFELDGDTIDNPLRSYVFQRNIVDQISTDNPSYSKPAGYETTRYPYSGLVGSEADAQATKTHNAQWSYPEAVKLLDENIVAWLNQSIVVDKQTVNTGIHQAFVDCLDAPSYTVFSNGTSAAEWSSNEPSAAVALESPHDAIHLAVGGFDVPGTEFSVIPGANGDMGENDTAGLDPIFFFHHCFIDRVFWLWQKNNGATDDLPVVEGYPGTNSVDSQGPTPGVPPNSWLSMSTALQPFTLTEDGTERDYVGSDAFDIENQLGYTYGPGSLDELVDAEPPPAAEAPGDAPKLHVTGVDRGRIRGSFLINAFAMVDGELTHIGTKAVLSRWHVAGCANCQTHLRAGASFPLHGLDAAALDGDDVQVAVHTRDGLHGGQMRGLAAPPAGEEQHFHVEIR